MDKEKNGEDGAFGMSKLDLGDEGGAVGGDDDVDNLSHLSSRPSPRLKEALSVKELMDTRHTTFEVDTEEETSLNLFDDEGSGHDFDEMAFYLREYFKSPAQQNEALMQAVTGDEALGDFEGLIPSMDDLRDEGDVKKLLIRKGNGKKVCPDGKVFINYIAFAEGKDDPFDSTIQRGKVEEIILKDASCIPGLQICLESMEVKEISKFWIHYNLCYGRLGVPPRIPAEAHCVFTIEVLEGLDADQLRSVHNMGAVERDTQPFEKVLKAAEQMKDEGNELYTRKKYREAIRRYRRGIQYMEDFATARRDEDEHRTDILVSLFNNTAQCYLKLNEYPRACTACRLALKLPTHPMMYKVFYRFAQAKFELGHLDEAQSLCKKAMERAPRGKNISEIENYMKKIQDGLKAAEVDLAKMYKKMFNKSSEPE